MKSLRNLRELRRHRTEVPPFIFAHRGASYQAPEDSISAWTLAAKYGHGLEGDFRRSSDNVQFCLHDTTLDRTTTSAGALNVQNAAFLDAVDNGSKYGVGYAAERLPRLTAMLAIAAKYGVWCLPEIEDTGIGLVAGRQIADQAKAYGIEERTIVQMFEVAPYTVLAQLVKEYPSHKFLAATLTGGAAPVPATVAAAGIQFLGVDITSGFVTKAWVDSMHAIGVRVAVYTVDDLPTLATARALGVDHIFTGRCNLMTRGRLGPRSFVESWKGETRWMWGDNWLLDNLTQQTTTGLRPNDGDCGLDLTTVLNAGAVNVGEYLPAAADSYTIDFSVKLTLANADATRWAAVQFALQQDALIKAFAPCVANGYGCTIRQNGTFSIDKYVNGQASVALVSDAASAALVVGTAINFRLTVTPTQLTLARLDNGRSVTIADATWRGGIMGLIWSNQASRFGPITVTKL